MPHPPDPTIPLPPEIASGGGERFGRFVLSERLGAGPSHDVWRAWDLDKRVWVVLRVWPKPSGADRESAAAAGKAARALAHVRIVPWLGAGMEGGKLWLARSFVDGAAFRDLPPADSPRLRNVALAAAEALAEAHAKGRAHGHLTAGNLIMPAAAGAPAAVLVDFGLSKSDAAGDVRGLGRAFCELLGMPSPGSGATTQAAPAKSETTRSVVEENIPEVDGALLGILLRARDGLLDARGLAAELGGWGSQAALPPARGRSRVVPAVAAGTIALVLAVGGMVLWRRRANDGARSDAAEGEERERDRKARDERDAEERRREATRRRLDAVRGALAEAFRYARTPDATRAELDRRLAPVVQAATEVLTSDSANGDSWALLADAAALAGFDSPPAVLPNPPPAGEAEAVRPWRIRADAARWVLAAQGPRAQGSPATETRFGLRLPGRDASATGRTARSLCAAPSSGTDPAFRTWATALSALLDLEADRARTAAQKASGAGPFTPDLEWILGIVDPPNALQHLTRAVEERPWDLLFRWSRAQERLAAGDVRTALADLDRAAALHPRCTDVLLQRALLLIGKGALDDALRDVEACAGRDPAALVVRAMVKRRRGDWEGAVADCDAALRQSPELVRAKVERVRARTEGGSLDGLVAEADAAVRMDPRRAESFLARAAAKIATGDSRSALDDVDASAEFDPASPSSRVGRAGVLLQLGELQEAQANAEAALKVQPECAEAFVWLACVKHARGDEKGAIRDAEEAIRLDPSSAWAWCACAAAWEELGDAVQTAKACARALELNPNHAFALYIRGNLRIDAGDHAGALEDFTSALRFLPGDAEARLSRAMALSGLGRNREAFDECQAVISRDPGRAQAYVCRAAVRLQSNDTLDVILADCDRALKIDPRCVPAWRQRAVANVSKSDPKAAVEDMTRALDIDGTRAADWATRARYRGLAGDPDGALADFGRAIAAAPNDARYLDLRSAALIARGDAEGALSDARKAASLDPGFSAAWFRQGEALRLKGLLVEAAIAYRKAAEVAKPGDPFRTMAERELQKLNDPR